MSLLSDNELNELRQRVCSSKVRREYKTYNGYTYPGMFTDLYQKIKDMEVHDDDIWIITFPKCGTTWTQEIVYSLMHNVDLSKSEIDIDIRFPFLEHEAVIKMDGLIGVEEIPYIAKSVEYVKNMPRPRFIKTHLPWDLLPDQITSLKKKPKIINVYRNPKDVCISYYHHSRLLTYYTGTFEEFAELFLGDKLSGSPYIKHVLSFWNQRHHPNIHIIKFEDMKPDLKSVIKSLAKFLNVQIDDEQMSRLFQHVSFDSMKNNKYLSHDNFTEFLKKNDLCYDTSGKFIRSGKSGGYKSEMSEELIQRFDVWIEKRLEKSELKF